MNMTTREQLTALYLDWLNDFASVTRWGEHHGLSDSEARALLPILRGIALAEHPEA